MLNESLFSTGKNDWATPQDFFDKLNEEFNFTLDACADETNAKCPFYFTEEQNSLEQDWGGHVVFCNPPYSAKEQDAFVKKCVEEQEHATTVLLIPARTDTKRFHDYILPNAEIRFVRGRLKFGDSKDSAPFPSMVAIFKKGMMGY